MLLRDYQLAAIESLRQGIREGHRAQVLVAPTGAGKTVVASKLIDEAIKRQSRVWFVCDRVSLIDQTSRMLAKYGLDHGVIQADHWRHKPWEFAQVVSAQTISRREITEWPKLIIWDECHTFYKSVTDIVEKNPEAKVIGLTATPFTKGMGKLFTNVVNTTTTNKLIADKWLVPLKAYIATTIDMTGAETKFDGEWKEKEIENRSRKIVGDIVAEWVSKTHEHFGGPVKTICFSASVPHGEELCRAFSDRGYVFQQVSYLDGNDEKRRKIIDEFRKPDSNIHGLISCEALAKGFDVVDILCGIGARPYRKSLSSHLQQLGRVMRPHEGKEYALWLDHAGNLQRFAEDHAEVFENGVQDLDHATYDAKPRQEKLEEEKIEWQCGECKYFFSGSTCPSCGWQRPRKKSKVVELAGEMKSWQNDAVTGKHQTWKEICWIAIEKKGTSDNARKFAQAQFKNMYGEFAKWNFFDTQPVLPTRATRNKVQSQLIKYFRSRGK